MHSLMHPLKTLGDSDSLCLVPHIVPQRRIPRVRRRLQRHLRHVHCRRRHHRRHEPERPVVSSVQRHQCPVMQVLLCLPNCSAPQALRCIQLSVINRKNNRKNASGRYGRAHNPVASLPSSIRTITERSGSPGLKPTRKANQPG